MNLTDIQRALIERGFALEATGVPDKHTMRAIDIALAKSPWLSGNLAAWPDERRLVAIEQLIYREAGIDVGAIDGLVGEQTRYARAVWAARQRGNPAEEESWRDAEQKTPAALPPAAERWPREADVEKFFGKPGDARELVLLDIAFPLRIAWEPTKTITRVQCHRLVHAALDRIWSGVLAHYGLPRLRELRLDMFGGCFNMRKKRGGSSWSMHSWGIAWDVDPDRNQLRWGRDRATLDDPPYAKFWEIVEAEGGVSLGRARNYDWMHFQFARL